MSASAMVTGDRPYLLGKSFFEILPLKLSRVTVTNDDIESLKFHHTSLEKYLYHMLVIWTKS